MPVEIKELHIKAVISPPKGEAEATGLPAIDLQKFKKEIVEECMEKLLKKLQEKAER